MNPDALYLRHDIKVEPLIDNWYAWPHLVSPATAARNITERHMKIMDSYIENPQIHASAVKNPKMLGGPFIDLGGGRVDEIRSLRDRISRERIHLVELSSALSELDGMLREAARGYSLQELYSRVPELLKGYVELVYDLNNQPSYRLIEALLYKSRYFDRSQQTVMLSKIGTDDRPFVLSTPRLESDECVNLPVPFDDPIVDELFKLKSTPKSWGEIHEMLRIKRADENLMHSFFTNEPAQRYQPYVGGGIRWRYFGHACILIESHGVSMLLDPVLSYTYESAIARYTYADLPECINCVLITHNHQDHILFETLLQIRHKVKTIIVPRNGGGRLQDPSLKLLLEHSGFRNVVELAEMETISVDGARVTGVPFFGEHADLDIMTKMAWLVRIGSHSLMFAADSCNIEPKLYDHIHREVGDVGGIFLGMECDGAPLSWIYGPLLTHKIDRGMDESRRLAGSNYEQAMQLITVLRGKAVYVYAMGQEPWLNYVMSIKYTDQSRPIVESNRLIDACRQRGIIAERLFGEREMLLESRALSA